MSHGLRSGLELFIAVFCQLPEDPGTGVAVVDAATGEAVPFVDIIVEELPQLSGVVEESGQPSHLRK